MLRVLRPIVMGVPLGLSIGACGDEAASAVVDGRRYTVGVVRDISVADADLTPYATVSDTNVPSYFLDDQAYALRDVDPTTLLLVRRVPNEDKGPFAGLWGDGQDPDVCRYFDPPRIAWCE